MDIFEKNIKVDKQMILIFTRFHGILNVANGNNEQSVWRRDREREIEREGRRGAEEDGVKGKGVEIVSKAA